MVVVLAVVVGVDEVVVRRVVEVVVVSSSTSSPPKSELICEPNLLRALPITCRSTSSSRGIGVICAAIVMVKLDKLAKGDS